MDLNCLGVRVFLCEDYSLPSSSALSVSFLGHLSLASSAFGVVVSATSSRPDINIPAVLLSDVGPRRAPASAPDCGFSTTVVRKDITCQCDIDSFAVALEHSMEYADASTVLEPVTLNATYAITTYDAASVYAVRSRCVPRFVLV